MRCPTVNVNFDNEQGFIIINEDDFDKEIHEIFKQKEKTTTVKEGSKAWYALKLTELGIEFKVTQSAKELKELFDSPDK